VDEAVGELRARLDIIELEAEYARAWDSKDADGWAAVFTEDGIFEIAPSGDRPATRVSGRADLSGYCAEFTAHTSGLHFMHLPTLTIEGERACGRLQFEFRFQRREPGESVAGSTAGYYLVRYRRTDEGWRIEHRLEKALQRDNRTYYEA
jgi:ketosteroid isomerase-like protein